jgi:thiamine pyrophosphate-dependent acetolactate synthase large subunit-like protein
MLMGIGSLVTIAARRPDNLAVLVLDNERYGETGNQPTHTAAGVDIAGVACSCGFPSAYTIANADGQARARIDLLGSEGPVIVVAKISPASAPLVLPPRDGGYLKTRFRAALLEGLG